MNLILILSSVFLNAMAQVFLKLWTWKLILKESYFDTIISILTNYFLIWGLSFYVISVVIWIYVLSKVEVSYAYPFLSLWFIIVSFLWFFLLGESMNMYKILWIIFIVFWVILIYKFS